VLWLAEEMASLSENAKENALKLTAARQKWRDATPSLAHAAWRSWHAAAWGGVVDAPAAVAALAPRKKRRLHGVDEANIEYGELSHVEKRWIASAGPARSEDASACALAAALVAGSPSGVASRAARILQMRLASRALRLRRPGVFANASSEWASLGALVAHVVLAHASEAREDDGEEPLKRSASRSAEAALREACAALARHCASSLAKTETSFTNDDDDDHAARAEALVDAFVVLIKKVRHAPFARVAETLVAPLVAEIARGAAAHAKRVADDFSDDDETSVSDDRRVTNAFVSGASALRELESCRRDRARRGHAWVLLGLARLNLLLPDGTPDPAAAAAATMEGFETRLRDETRPSLRAMAWQSAAPTVPNPPLSALVSVSDTERSLETRIDRLRSQVAPRPSPPKWHPLCREAAKFRDQLASVERVLGVARGLEVRFLKRTREEGLRVGPGARSRGGKRVARRGARLGRKTGTNVPGVPRFDGTAAFSGLRNAPRSRASVGVGARPRRRRRRGRSARAR
jgi:hypothetical protein